MKTQSNWNITPWIIGAVAVGATAATAYYCLASNPPSSDGPVQEAAQSLFQRASQWLPTSIKSQLPLEQQTALFNAPNEWGVTPAQRLVLDGKLAQACQVVNNIGASALRTSTSVTREMFESVCSSEGRDILNTMDLDTVDWGSLQLSQNCAVSQLRLRSGELLRLPGISLADAYKVLIERRYGKEAPSKLAGIFTTYLNPIHSFAGLIDKTSDKEIVRGLYPNEHAAQGFMGGLINAVNSLFGLPAGHVPQLIASSHKAYIACDAATGQAWENISHGHLNIKFALDSAQYTRLASELAFKENHPGTYRYLGENCADFVQKLFATGAGMSGHFAEHITPDQEKALTADLMSAWNYRGILYAKAAAEGARSIFQRVLGY